ncbi:hypothetical protein AB9K35_17805 [Leisingera sp. XS_AS12]|uniref:hypothetical protein n=1 Tax=Leisingera sp. XS_AS12 TaxID=3241294 RepID=UPI0035168612
MTLSKDAIIFGLGYLRGPKSKLSFGGEGADKRITERARAALEELQEAGYAVAAPADTQIRDREYYMGTSKEPHLGQLAKDAGIDPFGRDMSWTTFEKVADGPAASPSP